MKGAILSLAVGPWSSKSTSQNISESHLARNSAPSVWFLQMVSTWAGHDADALLVSMGVGSLARPKTKRIPSPKARACYSSQTLVGPKGAKDSNVGVQTRMRPFQPKATGTERANLRSFVDPFCHQWPLLQCTLPVQSCCSMDGYRVKWQYGSKQGALFPVPIHPGLLTKTFKFCCRMNSKSSKVALAMRLVPDIEPIMNSK